MSVTAEKQNLIVIFGTLQGFSKRKTKREGIKGQSIIPVTPNAYLRTHLRGVTNSRIFQFPSTKLSTLIHSLRLQRGHIQSLFFSFIPAFTTEQCPIETYKIIAQIRFRSYPPFWKFEGLIETCKDVSMKNHLIREQV